MEDAVAAVGADGEGLGVVLEGVGWRFGALVDDGEFPALFEEVEGGVGADAMDASRGDVAGYAKVSDVRLVPHALKLSDGDVVAFIVADSGEREVGDGRQDDDGGDDDLERALLGGGRHSVLLKDTPVWAEREGLGSASFLDKKDW